MRKLIFLWTYIEWGGVQIYSLAIMKAARAEWDVLVVLPRNSMPELLGYLDDIDVPYQFIDVNLDTAPAPTIRRKLQRHWRRIHSEWVSYMYLRRFNLPEAILHLETNPWQSWIYITALLMLGANVFITMHNALPRYPAWRELIWKTRMTFLAHFRRFHLFTANKDTKEKIKGWVPRSFWERIKVTYASIDPTEINKALTSAPDRNAVRVEHANDANSFVVLTVGQFIDRKGRWVLLEAAKKVIGHAGHVQFVWLTPKLPDKEDLARIESYGLGDAFRLVLSSSLGSTRQDILRFFKVADLFALPSFVEGLPISLLEAMAMRIPSISTRVNAIPEAIKDRETGILIEPGDADLLAKSILELKNDQRLREEFALAGRSFVLENFDERAAARVAIRAYEDCFTDAR